MKMARVPLLYGPAHGNSYFMDLDAFKKAGMFVFAENGEPMWVEDDRSDVGYQGFNARSRMKRMNYHIYKRVVHKNGIEEDSKEYIIGEHSETCCDER